MTRVIRNREGLYFKSGGAWTTYFEEAQKFNDAQTAINASLEFRLTHVDLVLVVRDQPSRQWDVVLPLFGP